MDLPSAAWGAGWLLMVETVVGIGLYLFWPLRTRDRSRDARDLARAKRKLNQGAE